MRLLAKSVPRGIQDGNVDDAVFLPGHLRESHDAALAILQSTGADQLKALGLAPDTWLDRFSRIVCLAAALHDLGKANNHFQGILQDIPNRNGMLQGLRHEWVTLIILSEPGLHTWLGSSYAVGTVDRLAFECAITGHHPAYGRPSPPQQVLDGTGAEMHLYLSHPDFIQSLDFVAEAFGLVKPPTLKDCVLSLLGGPAGAFSRLHRFSLNADETWEGMGSEEQRFVAAAKACLVAADTAGSALPRKLASPAKRTAWIQNAFAAIPTPEQIGEIVHIGLSGNELRAFQKAVADESGEVTFVKAGCGSGKTLAAYHWARTRCPGKRLYFCYPTTGTATEGYRDYLFDVEARAGRFGAELFHGRAEVDLDIILSADRDTEFGATADATDEVFARIESLNAWSTPIVSCTVDTVLGIVQNHRRALYSWPALAGAAFVFDEIHAYDQRLFGSLLRFLESVRGVPILLMTASLPRNRVEAIQNWLKRRGSVLSMPQRTDDLKALEERSRYHRLELDNPGDLLPAVLAEAKTGGKILWVCNTVDRAVDSAERAEKAGLAPIIYHSRFRYEDRVRRHKEVIEAFRKKGPALAICTQVAEMSLDLSATLLITDLAPVPALIQRLGRLNRRVGEGEPTKPFVVIEPIGRDGKPLTLPYENHGDWPRDAKQWLARLPVGAISQANLAAEWEALQADESEPAPDRSAWLGGGPVTQVLELRTGSPGLTVILEQDLPELDSGGKRLTEIALSMPPPPNRLLWKTWERRKGVLIAPGGTVDYNEQRGAKWVRNQK